jgi:hypothetical protein
VFWDARSLYVGGAISSNIGAASRSNLAKLSTTGNGDALPWTAPTDSFVSALSVNPSGALTVGGVFNSIAGQPRKGLAKILGDKVFANGFE